MPDRGYTNQRFWIGVTTLVSHPGPIHERLAEAYSYLLLAPTAAEVGAETAAAIEALHERMTNVPANGGEGSIGATVAQMSTEDAIEAARTILKIAFILDAPEDEEPGRG
jgi:hypothetical protein